MSGCGQPSFPTPKLLVEVARPVRDALFYRMEPFHECFLLSGIV